MCVYVYVGMYIHMCMAQEHIGRQVIVRLESCSYVYAIWLWCFLRWLAFTHTHTHTHTHTQTHTHTHTHTPHTHTHTCATINLMCMFLKRNIFKRHMRMTLKFMCVCEGACVRNTSSGPSTKEIVKQIKYLRRKTKRVFVNAFLFADQTWEVYTAQTVGTKTWAFFFLRRCWPFRVKLKS